MSDSRFAVPGDADEQYDKLLRTVAEREGASVDAFVAKGREQYDGMFEAARARAERRGLTVDALYEQDRALIEQSPFPGPSCLHPQEVELFAAGALPPERTAHALQCRGCTVMLEGLRPSPERAARWADDVRAAVAQARPEPKVIRVPSSRWKKFRDGFSWQPALAGAAAAWLLVAAAAFMFRPRLTNLQAYRRVAETVVGTEAARALVTEQQIRTLASTDPIRARDLITQKLLAAAPAESDHPAFRLTAARVADDVGSPQELAAFFQPKSGHKDGTSSVFFERVYFDAARKACEQLPPSTAGRDKLLADFETLRKAVFDVDDLSAWSKPYLAVRSQVESLLRSTASVPTASTSPAATLTPAPWGPTNDPPKAAADAEAAGTALRQCDAFLEKSASLRLAQFDPSPLRAMSRAVTEIAR
jgi:hypothetical protein